MRIAVLAVGRLGKTPEQQIAQDYLERATASGRALGLGPAELIEVEGRKPGPAAEGEALLARVEPGDLLVVCDERGEPWRSRGLAERVARWRDDGVRRLVLCIGGADGLDAAVMFEARHRLAFGPQTWPHGLVRAMLAEQIYRSVTILAGHPYHRE